MQFAPQVQLYGLAAFFLHSVCVFMSAYLGRDVWGWGFFAQCFFAIAHRLREATDLADHVARRVSSGQVAPARWVFNNAQPRACLAGRFIARSRFAVGRLGGGFWRTARGYTGSGHNAWTWKRLIN